MSALVDPFSLCFSGIWAVLKASPAFVAVVPDTNCIRYDHKEIRQPEKARGPNAQGLPADRPLVRLVPAGGVEYMLLSSSSTKFVKRYTLEVSLGDLRVNTWLNPLEFIMASALVNWQPVLMPITWNGDQFIKKLTITDITEGKNRKDLEQNIQSWAAIFALSAEMWFTSSKLKNLQSGDILIGDPNLFPYQG